MVNIITYIKDNYAKSFSLKELATRCGLNPSYFSRAFKQATGMPLFTFLNHLRVQKACMLLKRSNMPIIEVAYAVGYNNLSFFNRYFLKIIKMSPRDYKKYIQK